MTHPRHLRPKNPVISDPKAVVFGTDCFWGRNACVATDYDLKWRIDKGILKLFKLSSAKKVKKLRKK